MQIQEAVHHIDPRTMPARKRSMAIIQVTSERCSALPVCGNTVSKGVSTIKVYDDQVATVMALVETNTAGMEAARQSFMTAAALQVIDQLEKHGMSAQEMIDLIDAKTDQKVNAAFAEVCERTGKSVESEYHRMFGRDIKPLTDARVIEKDIVEPQELEANKKRAEEIAVTASAIANAMKEYAPAAQAVQQNQQGKGGKQ